MYYGGKYAVTLLHHLQQSLKHIHNNKHSVADVYDITDTSATLKN